jgi:hypothetical protein
MGQRALHVSLQSRLYAESFLYGGVPIQNHLHIVLAHLYKRNDFN